MKTFLLRIAGTGCLAAIFAGLVALALRPDTPENPSDKVRHSAEASGIELTKQAAPRMRSEVYYAAITERPLFAATRRPFVAETVTVEETPILEEPPAPDAEILPAVVLFGLMGGTDMRQALISVEGAQPEWISVGDKLGPWTLTDAGSDWLELSFDAQKIRLELYE